MLRNGLLIRIKYYLIAIYPHKKTVSNPSTLKEKAVVFAEILAQKNKTTQCSNSKTT
jgi:hypothetical protein